MIPSPAIAQEAARRATLEAFAQAWAARDIDGLLSLMTEACIYGASVGPEPGRTYRGQSEVRAGILAMLSHDRADRSETGNLVIAGDHAFWEWRCTSRDEDGGDVRTHGCDLFTFAGNKISAKQAFRKVLSR